MLVLDLLRIWDPGVESIIVEDCSISETLTIDEAIAKYGEYSVLDICDGSISVHPNDILITVSELYALYSDFKFLKRVTLIADGKRHFITLKEILEEYGNAIVKRFNEDEIELE